MATAAALIIGDEILSGKVRDENSPWLAKRCREIGVDLGRIVVLTDEVDQIAQEVRCSAGSFDWIFTSGGVGPTHDDRTMLGVARAFDLPVVEDPQLASKIRKRMGERLTPAALRMAQVPEGARLLWDEGVRFPLVEVRNIWIFPGVPELLQMKFDAACWRIAGVPMRGRRLVTSLPETDIAALLDATQARWPEVAIGSYPQIMRPPYSVTLTLDSRLEQSLEDCFAELTAALAGSLV